MADKLTEKQKLDYLKDPTKCPFCGSGQMQSDSDNNGETPSHQNFRCDCAVCKRSWVEVYKLERIETDEDSDACKFDVTVDITLRYDVVVETDTEEEAKARVMLMSPDAVRAMGRCASVVVKVVSVSHEHQWGEVERARFTGIPQRKCKIPFCNAFTMDLSDDEDDSVV